MFALGAYVGEVIRRGHGGEWRADDKDPEGEINMQLILPGGAIIRPIQRVLKRFANGQEDSLYVYGAAIVRSS
jgi:hypothetical protein